MTALPQKLAFIDTETTGCRVSDRIIEIGIIRVENNKLNRKFTSLINPERFVPEEILSLTGISSAQLNAAPTFYEIKKDILKLLEDCVLVAHNVRFDLSFLKNEFRRWEIGFSPKHFCTVKLSRYLYPQFNHHNLDSLIERFGFECKRRHRALDDAKILWDFYKLIQKNFQSEQLLKAVNKALKKPSVPLKISEDTLNKLPDTAGVYIFYGTNNSPLYVGKSINIKNRVMSHFASDHLSSKEMKIAQQVENIKVLKTSGELGALLKESSMVKKLQPLYNFRLRKSRNLFLIKSKITSDGYQKIEIESATQINPADLENIVGIFRSKSQIKKILVEFSKDYKLCEKLLGLEQTKGSCFSYKLGICNGACINKENPLKYNLRFLEAFYHNKIKPWPFNGPIIINEGLEGYLMDKWCYLGTVDKSGEIIKNEEISFDIDTYKILVKYLLDHRNQNSIRNLNNLTNANFI